MAKVIPVRGMEGRHTQAGVIEIRFTALDGKRITIAVTPSYADKVCEALQRLRGEPDTTAIETLPPASWKTLRSQAAGEPLRSGGFRVAADLVNSKAYLQIAQSDGTTAEIPMDETYCSRLIEQLGNALSAIRPPTGSA